jgi:hypothetical protein
MAPNVTKASQLRPNPNPIDPDVKVPEAVRRAAEAAEAAQRAAYPDQNPEPAPTPAPANPDTIVIAAPAPQPAPAPAPVTPVGNEPAPQPAPPAAVDDQTWEHKFKSEQGRAQQLKNQNAQLVDRLNAMEQMIQDLRAAPAPAPAPAPTPAQLISDEEREQFGGEMLDVMGRRAKEIVSPEIAEMRATIAALESKLTGTQTFVKKNARQEMLNTLSIKQPNWQEINQLDEFKSWLALPDPYSGATRLGMLLSAFEQNDTPRVLNFFKGFVSELAVTDPAPALDEPAPAAAPQPPRPGLESLAAPGRARTPAQIAAPAEKQIITPADVNAFYAAKRRGEYAGREAEFNALEQELFRAQREGRVRPV